MQYPYSDDYDDPLLAELYDQSEATVDDVTLLRSLIGGRGPWRILECFSGTGRILVPLARDSHFVTGIEIASEMSARARAKLAALGEDVARRATLRVEDALAGRWGDGYDLVILGANALYELASASAQERCVRLAYEALTRGGYLFVDNNSYRGEWPKGQLGQERVVFEGYGIDGSYGRETAVDLAFDEGRQVLRMRRTWLRRTPDGRESRRELLTSKRPVRAAEVRGWLERQGFEILNVYGDRLGRPFSEESPRAIFWATRARADALERRRG